MTEHRNAIDAQAALHHQYLLGLQLMVAVREGPDVIGEWMFRLFRRQHEEKFLSSFEKLGLKDLPDAVACARYHVLSNGIGGVPVEYVEEKGLGPVSLSALDVRRPDDLRCACRSQPWLSERLVCPERRVTQEPSIGVRVRVRGHDRTVWSLRLLQGIRQRPQ